MRNIIRLPSRPSGKETHWVQTPFLTVPAQYVRPAARSENSWSQHMGVFITYGELYKDTDYAENNQDIFLNELREFDFNSLLQNWAILNYLLKDGYGSRHHQDELNFVEAVFPDPPKQRLPPFLRS